MATDILTRVPAYVSRTSVPVLERRRFVVNHPAVNDDFTLNRGGLDEILAECKRRGFRSCTRPSIRNDLAIYRQVYRYLEARPAERPKIRDTAKGTRPDGAGVRALVEEEFTAWKDLGFEGPPENGGEPSAPVPTHEEDTGEELVAPAATASEPVTTEEVLTPVPPSKPLAWLLAAADSIRELQAAKDAAEAAASEAIQQTESLRKQVEQLGGELETSMREREELRATLEKERDDLRATLEHERQEHEEEVRVLNELAEEQQQRRLDAEERAEAIVRQITGMAEEQRREERRRRVRQHIPSHSTLHRGLEVCPENAWIDDLAGRTRGVQDKVLHDVRQYFSTAHGQRPAVSSHKYKGDFPCAPAGIEVQVISADEWRVAYSREVREGREVVAIWCMVHRGNTEYSSVES